MYKTIFINTKRIGKIITQQKKKYFIVTRKKKIKHLTVYVVGMEILENPILAIHLHRLCCIAQVEKYIAAYYSCRYNNVTHEYLQQLAFIRHFINGIQQHLPAREHENMFKTNISQYWIRITQGPFSQWNKNDQLQNGYTLRRKFHYDPFLADRLFSRPFISFILQEKQKIIIIVNYSCLQKLKTIRSKHTYTQEHKFVFYFKNHC